MFSVVLRSYKQNVNTYLNVRQHLKHPVTWNMVYSGLYYCYIYVFVACYCCRWQMLYIFYSKFTMMIFNCIISALLELFKTDIFSIWLETVHIYKHSQCHANFYFLNKTYTFIFFFHLYFLYKKFFFVNSGFDITKLIGIYIYTHFM